MFITMHQGYGAVMDLDVNPDVVGLVVPEHGGTADQIKGTCATACYQLTTHKLAICVGVNINNIINRVHAWNT